MNLRSQQLRIAALTIDFQDEKDARACIPFYLPADHGERITTYRHLILVDTLGDEQDVLYLLYLPADQGEDHYRHLILVDTTGDEQDGDVEDSLYREGGT